MPHFKHDCMDPSCCRYAGSVDGRDVYQSTSGEVIIRFGDDGKDYSCYPTGFAEMVAERNLLVRTAMDMIKTNIRR